MSEPEFEAHQTSLGRVYRLPVDLFSGLRGYARLVCSNEITALVDACSGFGKSHQPLECLAYVQKHYGEAARWNDLTRILIQGDEVLLSGDHILEMASPYQAPEQPAWNTGLGHYLNPWKGQANYRRTSISH